MSYVHIDVLRLQLLGHLDIQPLAIDCFCTLSMCTNLCWPGASDGLKQL